MSQARDSRITSEDEYRNIFEAVSDGLVIYDIGLDVMVEANSAACKMHSYTECYSKRSSDKLSIPTHSRHAG